MPRDMRPTSNTAPQKVKMRFKENKFYNDLSEPIFRAGVVYEVEGADWIQRWLKRGGEIVEGKLEVPAPVVTPSKLVPPKKVEAPAPVASKPVKEEEPDEEETEVEESEEETTEEETTEESEEETPKKKGRGRRGR